MAIVTKTPSARDAILKEIKQAGGSTVHELASYLGITTVAVRKHIATLGREGLLTGQLVKLPRGRPALKYVLTAAANRLFPQTYDRFLIHMVEDLRNLDGEEKLNHLFSFHNRRLLDAYRQRIANKPLGDQVRELVKVRDEEGYMATMEESAGGFTLIEHNCPIYELAQRFPQACNCEHDLFQQLLKAQVKREVTMVEGATACRYTITG